jgi:hypothetical protein
VIYTAAPVEAFERILDGYTFHTGFLAIPPPNAGEKH